VAGWTLHMVLAKEQRETSELNENIVRHSWAFGIVCVSLHTHILTPPPTHSFEWLKTGYSEHSWANIRNKPLSCGQYMKISSHECLTIDPYNCRASIGQLSFTKRLSDFFAYHFLLHLSPYMWGYWDYLFIFTILLVNIDSTGW
jgi:hypothetical protein